MAIVTMPVLADRRMRWSPFNAPKLGFRWRTIYRFGIAEAVALALFVLVAAIAVHYHEPWDDEAQAWLIARDNSVWQIVRYRLHYEGAPPAWHLLLHAFHNVGGTYAGIGWLSMVAAAGGVYVWLRWSPFPAVLRFLVPFTFFFAYQYAAVARSYVLFPLLTFSICVLYKRKRTVVWFALFAGLLANVSVQGFIVATVIAGLYLFDIYKANRLATVRGERRKIIPRRRLAASAALFAVFACTSIYGALPAPDLDFAIGDQVSTGTVHRTLVRLIGETPRNAPKPPREPPMVMRVPASDVAKQPASPNWHTQPRLWLRSVVEAPSAHTDNAILLWIIPSLGPPLLEIANVATWPLANSNLLACTFLLASVWWFRTRRALRMLLPWLALIAAGQVFWTAEQHGGLLLIALIAGVWLAADNSLNPAVFPPSETVFVGLFVIVLVNQIAWSVSSIHAEVVGPYDPGVETARWLKEHPVPRVAAFGFHTVSIQPWYPATPFFNVPTSWWQWSSNVEVDGIHRQIIASHPDVVVYGMEFLGYGQVREQWLPMNHLPLNEMLKLPGDPIARDLKQHGYRETHVFCGTRFTRLASGPQNCQLVFEPFDQAAVANDASSAPGR